VRATNLTIFSTKCHYLQNRNFANIFTIFQVKKIITGKPRAVVVVHVPRVVVGVDTASATIRAVVPVTANH